MDLKNHLIRYYQILLIALTYKYLEVLSLLIININMSIVTGTSESFKEMLKRVNAAYKSEHGYLKKLSDFNQGIRDLQLNIEKLVLPVEEAKLKAAKQLEGKKKEEYEDSKLNQEIVELLKTLTEKDVLDGRTTIEILDSIDKNTTASSKTTNDLLEQLVDRVSTEHSKQISDFLEKLNEAQVLNNEAMNTFMKASATPSAVDKGNFQFGDETVNIKYNDDLKMYYLKHKNVERQMSETGFNELFTKEVKSLVDIPKRDFVEFGLLIRDTKAKSFFYNNELIKEIKDAIGTKRIDSSVTPVLNNLYDSKTKTGQGVIILLSSTKELKHKLQLILASIKAGNNSNDMKNEASAIIDQLSKNKKISNSQKSQLLLNIY